MRRDVVRMTRAQLEAEVLSLRMSRVAGGRTSKELLDCRAELRAVERSAREIVERERQLRTDAERSAAKFHALLLAARVAALPPRRTP